MLLLEKPGAMTTITGKRNGTVWANGSFDRHGTAVNDPGGIRRFTRGRRLTSVRLTFGRSHNPCRA
jgi:hypothetical protein